ncbi:MAG: hypothetical protein OSA04_02645 [Flavobacteriales bacterium]|nr:hypothetical protein [Flavobacteriales bacterium]
MISKTFFSICFLLVGLMLVSQCAVSISWVLSGSYLSHIENTDLTNKTTENNESNETSETDAEDDTEEKEFIIHHPINATSKLESKSESNSIDNWIQSLSLDVKGIPPDLS